MAESLFERLHFGKSHFPPHFAPNPTKIKFFKQSHAFFRQPAAIVINSLSADPFPKGLIFLPILRHTTMAKSVIIFNQFQIIFIPNCINRIPNKSYLI